MRRQSRKAVLLTRSNTDRDPALYSFRHSPTKWTPSSGDESVLRRALDDVKPDLRLFPEKKEKEEKKKKKKRKDSR